MSNLINMSQRLSPPMDFSKRPSYLEIPLCQQPNNEFDDGVVRSLDKQFKNCEEEEAEPIKTYLRIRPYVKKEDDEDEILEIKDDRTVVAKYLAPGVRNKGVVKNMEFKFSKVLDGLCSQEHVFDQTISPLLDRFDAGENCLVFSYGATNSGKTYTMRGSSTKYGIIPRTLYHIFDRHQERIYKIGNIQPFRHDSTRALPDEHLKLILEKKKVLITAANETNEMKARANKVPSEPRTSEISSHCDSIRCVGAEAPHNLNSTVADENANYSLLSMWITFVELYNEKCYDLLASGKRSEVKIVNDKSGYSYFKDVTELPVFGEEEAYALYVAGYKKLEVSATQANISSSRSHSFFTIRVVELGKSGKSVFPIKVHRITFCDLAGNERQSQTENTGGQLRESANINNSLLSLLKVIRMIRDKQSRGQKQAFLEKIPFRDSKLTRIFQGYFTTSTHIAMIVNVNPTPKMADSSMQTLQNSAIASNVVAFRPKPPPQIRIEDVKHNTSFLHSSIDLEDVEEQTENEDDDEEENENIPPPTPPSPPINRKEKKALFLNAKNSINAKVECVNQRGRSVLHERNSTLEITNLPSPKVWNDFKKPFAVDKNYAKIQELQGENEDLRNHIKDLSTDIKLRDRVIDQLNDKVKTIESELREQMLVIVEKEIAKARDSERRRIEWSGPRVNQFRSRFEGGIDKATQTRRRYKTVAIQSSPADVIADKNQLEENDEDEKLDYKTVATQSSPLVQILTVATQSSPLAQVVTVATQSSPLVDVNANENQIIILEGVNEDEN